MQSRELPVNETTAVYCQALMTTGGTADAGAKPLAVTSSQRHVQTYPTSHLVTNRAYTASNLTSDYVSEMSVERPSKTLIGTVPRAKSEPESHLRHPVGHNITLQRKDIPDIDNTGNNVEYVHFIHPSSHSSSYSASTSEKVKTEELARHGRNQTSSRAATLAKNDSALYCEIEDNNDDYGHYTDVVPPASGYSAAAYEVIVVERDNLLQHVNRLTTEKQEMVYKLRDFVETNAQLHAELECCRAAIVELQNKLHEVESALESVQYEKALMNSSAMELTSVRTSNSNEHYVNQQQSLNSSLHRTLEGAVVKTGEVDSIGSSSSSGVLAELRQAVQLAVEQQQQLEELRDIVKQQNMFISRLCRRDVTLGLELRQTTVQNKDACTDVSYVTSAQPAAAAMTPPVAAVAMTTAAATEPVKQEVEVVVSRLNDTVVPPIATVMSTAVHTRQTPMTSSSRVDAVLSTHLPPPAFDRRTRRSPPPPTRTGIETPTSRPTSHTAPARPLARTEPKLVAAASATRSDLESLPVGYEMATMCPICQAPIPFDATSSEVFSRHVDECISRVAREGPTASSSREASATDRMCPLCNVTYPTDKFSQTDFERHVNSHFIDDDGVSQQFEYLP